MALEHRLELRLTQKLILTPQLQLAIKLLQLPQLELSQSLTNEMVENPLLEEVIEEAEKEELSKVETDETERFEELDDTELPLERMMRFSVDEYFEDRSSDGRDLGYFTPGTVVNPTFEQFVSKGATLYDHLSWQLRLSEAEGKIRDAGEVVIGNIGENGYLESTAEEIAGQTGCSLDTSMSAIRLIQTFDPPGVGARDLRECLLLQLKPLGLKGGLVESLISNDIQDIGKKRYPQLARKYGCPLKDVLAAVKVIEGLEPKPGRNFSPANPIYIVPDVYVIKSEGKYHIVLNDEGIPRLKISNYYRRLLSRKNSLPKEERVFLEQKFRSAVWLLRSLDQRNKTIYRITEYILRYQRGFFEHGVQSLRPLNLKEVADELGVHESTVSRATSNKYLACHHGILGFRYFFSSGVRGGGGNGKVSSTSVKELIQKLVASEDPKNPLSDQKLVELLKEHDVVLARRTVAKYRDELKISPITQRKIYE